MQSVAIFIQMSLNMKHNVLCMKSSGLISASLAFQLIMSFNLRNQQAKYTKNMRPLH